MTIFQKIIEFDRQFFLLLNGWHSPWLDQPMFYISTDWFWIPLYAYLLFLLIRKMKKAALVPFLAVVLAISASDQLSGAIKKKTQRFRPSHDTELVNSTHTVNDYRGGKYGFVSSHAANTFCLLVLLSSFLNLTGRSLLGLFIWASTVSFSRIYLGVHFPLDVLCGAILGAAIGASVLATKKELERRNWLRAHLP
jgi:undecaprenyl-diphosphatase